MPDTHEDISRYVYGWFGPPWPSGICWDEHGRLRAETRIPVPVGHPCLHCTEPFGPGDGGKAVPCVTTAGMSIGYGHKECLLRMTTGPLAHLDHRCTCYDGTDHEAPGMTARQEAVAVWERVTGGT